MKPDELLSKEQQELIVKTIGQVEAKMSGEIRVFISGKKRTDPVAAAQRRFVSLGMDKTSERNGVLIYVAPKARKFAVIGDKGIHEKCGDPFWREVVEEMGTYFRVGNFGEGIVHGIQRAGKLMAEHFPPKPGHKNELPDDIAHD